MNLSGEAVAGLADFYHVSMTWCLPLARCRLGAACRSRHPPCPSLPPHTHTHRCACLLLSVLQIPPERVLVVYDDLDLPTGTVRLRPRGGPGGHGGMKSVAGGVGHSSRSAGNALSHIPATTHSAPSPA